MSEYLYEELIVEFFTRLPSKSLIRFRSLSKSLYSCISSPSFIQLHTFRSRQKVLSIHYYSKTEAALYTLHEEDQLSLSLKDGYIGITTSPCPLSSFYRIVSSCNGIFCLQNCLENRNRLTLWNPSIRRVVSLLEYPRKIEPLLEGFGFGFGFDPISDDYKIIKISYDRDTSLVYAVKTGTWHEIASPKPKYKRAYLYKACFLNGVLHWPLSYTMESEEMHLTCSILTFNLSTHIFGVVPLPTPTWHWISPISNMMETKLTTIQGSLALISYGTGIQFHDTSIRVRRDSSWSVVYKLSTIELYIRGALRLQPQPNNDDDLLLTAVGGVGEVLHVYNPKMGELLKHVYVKASRLIYFRRFVETLHLLDMGEAICETTQL